MKFLYLIAKQHVDESVVCYLTEVVEKMKAGLHILVVSKDKGKEKSALKELEALNLPLSEENFTISAQVGDPVDAMLAALEANTYDMVMMGVHRRRRVIPSQFRFMSQRIIKNCPIPIMLIRRVSKKLDRILVCTGGKEISEPVVELSTRLAGTAD
ncbi:MAG TPA: universal stress protein [Anaerolineales bacterium]|nr:universal stress protein [Anaerolineales bacterium]